MALVSRLFVGVLCNVVSWTLIAILTYVIESPDYEMMEQNNNFN